MTEKDIAKIHELFALVMEMKAPAAPALARIDEPKWNSLKHVELLLALEDAFGIRFSEDEMMRADSLPAIANLVDRHQQAA